MSEVIVITSGKGGVGKTTTTANIGTGLAQLNKKVVMIDTDIGLRNLDVVMGLENRMGIQVGTLSGGQRQALALVIANMTDLELLILDEHTAALDPRTAAKVLDLSDRIVQEHGLTTLMITHNMKDAIAHGNRLIMMDAGQVVVDVSGEEKKKLTVPDLLAMFSRASGSDEANDKMLLS